MTMSHSMGLAFHLRKAMNHIRNRPEHNVAMTKLIPPWTTQVMTMTLHKHNGITYHWQIDCLFNSLLRMTTKKTSKLHITRPFWGETTSHQRIPLTKGQWCECIPMVWHSYYLLKALLNALMPSHHYIQSMPYNLLVLRHWYNVLFLYDAEDTAAMQLPNETILMGLCNTAVTCVLLQSCINPSIWYNKKK